MSRAHRPLKDRMLQRLLQATGWTGGAALASGLSTCPTAIEDALADLVVGQLAEYRAGAGYRVNGSVLCRTAMRKLIQQLKAGQGHMVVEGQPFGDVYRWGVAEKRPGVGLVMYELEAPFPPDLGPQMALMDGFLQALERKTTREQASHA